MFHGVRFRATKTVLVVCSLTAACSSFDEDTPDHLDFALPSVTWTLSANDPQWRSSPSPDAFPTFVCGGPQALTTDCCAPPYDCQRYPLACDPTTNFCALTFDVELAKPVDLVDTSLGGIRGRVLSKVEMLGLSTTVQVRDLPIQWANLYLGPKGVSSSSDAQATLVGPVSLLPGENALILDGATEPVLLGFARDYETPFALLLVLHVVVPPGAPGGAGALEVTLNGELRAFY